MGRGVEEEEGEEEEEREEEEEEEEEQEREEEKEEDCGNRLEGPAGAKDLQQKQRESINGNSSNSAREVKAHMF